MKTNTQLMEPLPYKSTGRTWTGLILIVAGLLLLAYKMGAPVPEWLMSWPLGVIVLGIIISFRSKLRSPAGPILIVIGAFNLVELYMPELHVRRFIVPIIIILAGLFFVFRPHFGWKATGRYRHRRNRWNDGYEGFMAEEDANDHIDATAVLGGVKKIIVSKNFKGGDITCFMGGVEIDLTQADIQEEVSIDITAVFGGCKLIIPGNWEVKSEVSVVFGGLDDKRAVTTANLTPGKVLRLEGTAVFGGIDIRSY